MFRIEQARAEDAPTLSGIALAAKRHWGYPERWIELWRPQLTISPRDVEDSEIYCSLTGAEIIGFYRLIPFELEHLWVLPSYMGKRIGRALFEHAKERARSAAFPAFQIESDPNAAGFYAHMGCVLTGTVTREIDGCSRELPLFKYEI